RVATLLLPAVALLALDAAWDVRVAAGLWCAVLCWLADGRRGPRALLAAAAVFPVLRLAWPALFAEHRAFADWLASVPIRVLAAVSQENARALVAGPTATGVPLVALALTAVVAASLRA